jgi:hypothetical protein
MVPSLPPAPASDAGNHFLALMDDMMSTVVSHLSRTDNTALLQMLVELPSNLLRRDSQVFSRKNDFATLCAGFTSYVVTKTLYLYLIRAEEATSGRTPSGR